MHKIEIIKFHSLAHIGILSVKSQARNCTQVNLTYAGAMILNLKL